MGKRHRGPFHLLRTVIVLAVMAALLSVPSLRSAESTVSNASTAPQPTRVWVNTASGKYHCPGSQFYGTTKRGAYMTEVAARAAGNQPAYGRTCDGSALTRADTESLPMLGTAARSTSVRVWANTSSGVYHCPGTRYYEATKRGRHLSERAAQDSGYRPANGRTCG